MDIAITVKSKRFRYLWLKSVTGFNPQLCCAKSLVGSYSKILPFRGIKEGSQYKGSLCNDPPFWYLCGVTSKYADNLHIAFSHAPGQSIRYEDANACVVITDACQVAITPLPESAEGVSKEQSACRNYRFGRKQFLKNN